MSDHEGQDTGRFVRALIVVFVGLLLSQGFGAMFAAIPVAVYAIRGQARRGLGFVVVSALAGALGMRSAASGLWMGLSALSGYGIGFGLRRMSFGWAVALTTAVVFAVSCLGLIAEWSEIGSIVREWSAQAETSKVEGESATGALGGTAAQYEVMEWTARNWPNALFGLTFFSVLMSASIVASLAARWVRARDGLSVLGSFRTMRPPEWLVWLLILAAGLAYADYRTPSDWMRLVSWNALIGLSGVYWINGVSILVYAIAVWKPHPLISIAIVFGIVILRLGSLLPVLGLFDTWGEFRMKIDRWQAARTATGDSDDELS